MAVKRSNIMLVGFSYNLEYTGYHDHQKYYHSGPMKNPLDGAKSPDIIVIRAWIYIKAFIGTELLCSYISRHLSIEIICNVFLLKRLYIMKYFRNPKIIFLVIILIFLGIEIKNALSHSIRDIVKNGEPINILLLGIDARPGEVTALSSFCCRSVLPISPSCVPL
jgi:hypothetical protein